MKKRFSTLFFILALLASLCLTASASQAGAAENEPFAVLWAVSANEMETDTLSAGVGDPITLHLYVNVDETAQTAFTLQYNDAVFTLQELAIAEAEGQGVLTATGVSAGSISFTYQYNAASANQGLVQLATLTFSNKADIAQTAYTFSLHNGQTQLCDPVSVKVDHRHAFGGWTTVSVSEDGKMQKQKRDCLHCDMREERTVPYVDYSIALKDDAKKISYNADKKMLYAIAPGTTVGTLIDSLTTGGTMQVIDKNGNGKSRNDVLATGMTLLVLDEGDGMDANVQFAASVSVWGDGDGDGEVTAGDARIALRYSVDLEKNLSEEQLFALDSDNNNKIDAGDARFILRVSVNLDAFYAVKATSVLLSESKLTMNIGEQKTLTAILFPTDTTIRTMQWNSSNTSVATVSNGVITAKAKGTAVITATANSGVYATCTVTVHQAVEKLTVNRTNFYLPVGKTRNLTDSIAILPSEITAADAVWTSSNSAVTVKDGVVSCVKDYNAVANKTAKITCTFPCGTSASFNITLLPENAKFCGFKYETIQVNEGQQFKLSGVIQNASLKVVSDNTEVLSVDSGNVITAKAAGTATLTCSGVDYTEKVTVTVKSKSLRVVSVVVNSGGNDLAVTVKNIDTQGLTKIDMTVVGYDKNGKLLTTKGCAISNLASGVRAGYVWKDLWGNAAVVSAAITKITLTYADGHMASLPAGCWHTGE
ncbi:MAG: Ig-like domain-containing protein [Clostridia bacterium]|nr:Ig-like domain-containing protein [Clostridia bacterium]